MFDIYPKKRIELPEKYRKIYKEHYKKNREGETSASGLARKMETWLHKKIASDLKNNFEKSTLEIGAGTLNQLKFEQTKHYDIIEPYKELYSGSPLLSRIKRIFTDIDEIDLNEKYDRITSVATFEHIVDLPKVVAKTCLLLNSEGSLRTSIPNEGTFLWTLGWMLTTGIEFKMKYGLNYRTLMRYEHVNTAREIEQILHYFYAKNKCSCFGISKGIAFYRFYESSEPRIDVAKEYLTSLVG
jgi:hypothetical protein